MTPPAGEAAEADASAAPPLEVRGLTRRYGSFTAVRDLSLTVGRGEIVGFLGPNGAGKTTTLRCCCGLLRPDAGVVRIAGAALAGDTDGAAAASAGRAARARLGFVPDRPFLYERLTGREFLEFVAALYDVDERVGRDRVAALAGRLALDDALDDLIETYSLGTRQKTSIAAALVHDPPLLMLDEPLGGLDPRAARGLKDLLHERAARGHGALVSTHLLDVAERLCDRVVVIQHGHAVAAGTLAALRAGHAEATLEDLFLELTREPEDGAS